MSKRIYFLNDVTENCVDAVIIAKTSTKKEIEDAIDKAKEIDAYTWEDILESLPDDCEVYDRWNNDMIYY